MTPPRDPDSGKGRVPYVNHAFREVPTRPGPHVDPMLDTLDDFNAPTPVEMPADLPIARVVKMVRDLGRRVIAVEATAIESRIRLEQSDSLPSTEWARAIDKEIAAVAIDAKAGGDVARAIRRVKALVWGALGTAIAGLGTALWFALGVAKASGVSEGVAREREIQRVKDAARLDAVEAAEANLSRELSRVLGILDGSRPYRAAPYLGPPPDPEP